MTAQGTSDHLTIDGRIPPTGGSGTAPPRGERLTTLPDPGPMRLTLDTAALDHLIGHLRAEIDRLTARVRAEEEHNRRLMGAVAFYRSAAVVGEAAASRTFDDGNNGREPDIDTATGDLDRIRADVKRGDGIALPLATP